MKSYIVTCSSSFRDAVNALARRKNVTASDLVTAVLVLKDHLDPLVVPDPGDAASEDRDDVILKSGSRAGRRLRRKPRLQLRLPAGLCDDYIRRALAMLLALDSGERALGESDPATAAGPSPADAVAEARERAEEMRALVSLMTFDPIPDGVRTIADAVYVLGLPPGMKLTRRIVKARFRMLSQIYHPDRETGDTLRMTQLIEASRLMEAHLRQTAAA